MLEKIKRFRILGSPSTEISAAAALPPPVEPKVKAKQQTLPSHLRTATPDPNSALPITDRRLANTDITTIRTRATTRQTMREFIAASPDLASAVFAYLRVSITQKYTAVARNPDGSFNVEATGLVNQILTRMDYLGDYSDGFCGVNSIRSTAESLAKELLSYGGMSAELVLDKSRLPKKIQPVSVSQIQLYPDKEVIKPVQVLSGEEIDLDIPTFFMTFLDQDLLEAYPTSPLEPALQPVIFQQEFMNDLRRIVKKAVHPRLHVTIDEEKFLKMVPSDTLMDEEKLAAYQNNFTRELQEGLNGLKPEEAMVVFSAIKAEYLNNGNSSISQEWSALEDISNSKLATGAKSLPAILGHGVSSSNIASTETMLFVKYAAGAVQYKLNELFSRILTLAVRLFGEDVTVEFAFQEIELRTDAELEAFKAQKQSRLLELLSLGVLTDEEASLQLVGRLPHPGAPKLSGTGFMSKKVGADAENPNGEANDGSTLNQKQGSSAPKDARGGNKKSSPVKAA